MAGLTPPSEMYRPKAHRSITATQPAPSDQPLSASTTRRAATQSVMIWSFGRGTRLRDLGRVSDRNVGGGGDVFVLSIIAATVAGMLSFET
jgi:hypothetical protein